MKKVLLILLLNTSAWAACPLFTYPENHKLDAEINNVCDNILNPTINYETVTKESVSSLSVSTITAVSSATVTNLSVTNLNGSLYLVSISSQASTVATTNTTSASFTAVPALTVTITPLSTSAKFFVSVTGYMTQTTAANYICFASIRRNGSDLGANGQGVVRVDSTGIRTGSANMAVIDAPSTVSSVTYSVFFSNSDGTSTCQWNRDALLSTISVIPVL